MRGLVLFAAVGLVLWLPAAQAECVGADGTMVCLDEGGASAAHQSEAVGALRTCLDGPGLQLSYQPWPFTRACAAHEHDTLGRTSACQVGLGLYRADATCAEHEDSFTGTTTACRSGSAGAFLGVDVDEHACIGHASQLGPTAGAGVDASVAGLPMYNHDAAMAGALLLDEAEIAGWELSQSVRLLVWQAYAAELRAAGEEIGHSASTDPWPHVPDLPRTCVGPVCVDV